MRLADSSTRCVVKEGMHHGEFQKGNIEDMVWAIVGTANMAMGGKFFHPKMEMTCPDIEAYFARIFNTTSKT